MAKALVGRAPAAGARVVRTCNQVDQSVWLALSVGASLREGRWRLKWPFHCSLKTGVESAKRTVLGLVLVCVLVGLGGKLVSFGRPIVGTAAGRSRQSASQTLNLA